jgi:hypothetical protein
MPELEVTHQEVQRLAAQLSPAARASLLYVPGPQDGPGHVQFPDEHATEILAADLSSPAAMLHAYARDQRWRAEIGGTTIAGIPIATDDRSKIMIVGARVAAQADPGWQTVWRGIDGAGYPIDASAMIAISDGVQAHVNATFALLATVTAAIEAGTITSTEQIDAAFQPLHGVSP